MFVSSQVISDSDKPYGKAVKEINIEGLTKTKEYIVTRELLSKVGEPCLKENLLEEFARLDILDIFSEILIKPQLKQDSVVISYSFVETFNLLPVVAIQINDENGISAGGGVKMPNLFGRDIYLSARALFGGATTIEVTLDQPWVKWNRIGYRFDYFHRDRLNKGANFHEIADEMYLNILGSISKYWKVGIHFDFVILKSDVSGITLSPDNKDHVFRSGLYFALDTRDAYLDTKNGWWNEISYTNEMKAFNSSSDFNQIDIDIRRYIPLKWERHGFALFSLMTLRTGTVGINLADWQQFNLGGTNTVRGWQFAYHRGKNQFINTLEYRYSLIKPQLLRLPLNFNIKTGIQLAAFADYGAVWDEKSEFAAKKFLTGYGVGIRFFMPMVGLLRLDVGWGQQGEGAFLHLGSFEKPVLTRRRVR